MNTNHLYLLLMIFLSKFTGNLFGQDTTNQSPIFPEGISPEYGIGNYSVTDEYISKEKFSDTLPYYSILWSNQHSNYVYHLMIDFRNSTEIKYYNISTVIYHFTPNKGFSNSLPKFTMFNKDTYVYLGPSTELFLYYNNQNIAVSGFDYAQSIALLISAGFSPQFYYKLWNNFNRESSLDFNVFSLGFRMVDEEETDETPVKIRTMTSANN